MFTKKGILENEGMKGIVHPSVRRNCRCTSFDLDGSTSSQVNPASITFTWRVLAIFSISNFPLALIFRLLYISNSCSCGQLLINSSMACSDNASMLHTFSLRSFALYLRMVVSEWSVRCEQPLRFSTSRSGSFCNGHKRNGY